MTDSAIADQARGRLPGEDSACLQIAAGILGALLLIAASWLSRWRWSAGTRAGVTVLMLAMVMLLAAGFSGLKLHRQPRAASMMLAGDTLLTICALAFLIVSLGGAFSWAFPLGSIFTTVAIFSDAATYRFRRALSRASNFGAA